MIHPIPTTLVFQTLSTDPIDSDECNRLGLGIEVSIQAWTDDLLTFLFPNQSPLEISNDMLIDLLKIKSNDIATFATKSAFIDQGYSTRCTTIIEPNLERNRLVIEAMATSEQQLDLEQAIIAYLAMMFNGHARIEIIENIDGRVSTITMTQGSHGCDAPSIGSGQMIRLEVNLDCGNSSQSLAKKISLRAIDELVTRLPINHKTTPGARRQSALAMLEALLLEAIEKSGATLSRISILDLSNLDAANAAIKFQCVIENTTTESFEKLDKALKSVIFDLTN